MNAAAPDAAEDAPPGGPPPWIDETIQQQIGWRDGDIVIAVPPKSGTTWTMNIVHQLRSGGDATFADIYSEVPWIEFVSAPTKTVAEIVTAIDAMPTDRRRAFKTHAGPGVLPFQIAGAGIDVRYVVVVRSPNEALASFRPFIAAHSDAWFDLWQVPKNALIGTNLDEFFVGMGSHMLVPMVFGFLAAWWPMRHAPNVHFVHYADLKRDPASSIRGIADFLGFAVSDAQWPAILEYTSFAWMKAHEDKFELRGVTEVPILDPGAMIRKGQVGASGEDGVTPEIAAATAAIGRTILTDNAAFDWVYCGGALPE